MSVAKQLFITSIFCAALFLIYRFSPYPILSLDNAKIASRFLFAKAKSPGLNEEIILINTGKLNDNDVSRLIDTLLRFEPRIIGVNTCDLKNPNSFTIPERINSNKIVLSNCSTSERAALSRIVTDHNAVTHFRTNPESFEMLLSSKNQSVLERGNESERINYHEANYYFYQIELKDATDVHTPIYKDKIILIGYMGDYITEEVQYFRSCRITPLNSSFDDQPVPDMYDIQISALILEMINTNTFIHDCNNFERFGIMLIFCITNVMLITFLRTRWIFLNVIIGLIITLSALTGIIFVIIYGFLSFNIYLELHELPLMILITSVFSFWANLQSRKSEVSAAQAN
jgi:hypothetical protein